MQKGVDILDLVLKKKIKKIVDERSLYRVMSNSKWCDLLLAMETEMPFEPPFILKRLDEDIPPEENIIEDQLSYLGDWSFENICNGNFFVIDWLKIYPFYYIHQNHLDNPKKIDAAEELKKILNTHDIPYTIKNEIFIIHGYNK